MSTVPNIRGKSILLVDDDPAVRESIKLLLSIDRHVVTEAASGHEALQLFTGSRYDYVITDYFMPEMLGEQLAQNIKSLAPGQPVLMITAYVEKLVKAGTHADAVLGKPLSVDDLRQAMAMAPPSVPLPDTTASASACGSSPTDPANLPSTTFHVLGDIFRRN
jgi:CheY-like chemotaxis protein